MVTNQAAIAEELRKERLALTVRWVQAVLAQKLEAN